MSRKEAILEAALKLFNQTNTQSATTNHIAKAMGISPGNLHYHYKNREEIVRLLYLQLREEAFLSVAELPKNIQELQEHEKLLIQIQWKYRFFFKEMLFLFSRDKELEEMYIKDNIAHRERISHSMKIFEEEGELVFTDKKSFEFVVDSILMAWQFYASYLHTLGKTLDSQGAVQAVEHTHNAMRPYMTHKEI
ncbi:TetR/AcrR family transcriptional regulator [Sulfurimonas sp. SAG-AH-194-C20]|nr:TetR/AcrR family transcriptional regulator [Sulfurimonas sp. SAG-AH-194-C20]MDF1878117.1 TetR/AcrR family transcriptional regulator [Sulfurimonas sp. SAG-AH-194-C20]